MRHITHIAVDLCRELLQDGLDGVQFHEASVFAPELLAPVSDLLDSEIAEAWNRDYCSMTLHADTGVYCECCYDYFDHEGFQKKLRERFTEAFGRDVIEYMERHRDFECLFHYGGYEEFEVSRRQSPYHDFNDNPHSEPLDPLVNND